NGVPVASWHELKTMIRDSHGKELVLEVMRGEELLTFKVTPTKEKAELDALFGAGDEEAYRIGIAPVYPED
ncbi:MAG: hypothetical protein KDD62_04475, partial [Bdellovibrionales bacterium]|nr:hypothetical protein [Bdellovibrionales bacterium]